MSSSPHRRERPGRRGQIGRSRQAVSTRETPAALGKLYDAGLWKRLSATLAEAVAEREDIRRQAAAWLARLEKAATIENKLELIFEGGFQPAAVADRLIELARTPGPDQGVWAWVAGALDSTGPDWQSVQAAARGALGEALLSRGDLAGAEHEFFQAGRAVPFDDTLERALLCRRQGHLRWQQGRLDEAAALLRRAEELARDLDDTLLRVDALLDLGDLCSDDLVEPDRARETYETILGLSRERRWPPAWHALQGLVRVHLLEHRADLALEILDGKGARLGWPRDSRESLVLGTSRGRAKLALGRAAATDLARAFRKLLALEAFAEAALAATAWLRAEAASPGLAVALGEIALTATGEGVPPLAREPFEKLVWAARAGQLSAGWLEAQEEALDRALARRRHPFSGDPERAVAP